VIHNRKYLKQIRKDLRNNLTSAEAILWKALQRRQLEGRKFRRQHSIKNFVVDFYCPSEKLIIELDGAHHFTSAGFEKDRDRDRTLKDLGFKILRFENQDVFDSLENVLESIRSNFGFPPCKEG
jgi:very-short-patch-repair endonuclease